MKLDSELRTLLYLKKSLDEDVPSKKTLIILKLIMASLVMVCVLAFMATSSGFLSPLFAIFILTEIIGGLYKVIWLRNQAAINLPH